LTWSRRRPGSCRADVQPFRGYAAQPDPGCRPPARSPIQGRRGPAVGKRLWSVARAEPRFHAARGWRRGRSSTSVTSLSDRRPPRYTTDDP
jgi:hypothetical protein